MKVVGSENPADVLTKYKSLQDYVEQLSRVSLGLAEAVQDGKGTAQSTKDREKDRNRKNET